MSTGTLCLTCRLYIRMADPQYACRCEKPVPSDDGKTPNPVEQIRRTHPLATACRSCGARIGIRITHRPLWLYRRAA